MALSRPRFIPTVRRLERAVGAPLESAIAGGQGVDTLLRLAKLSRRGLSTVAWARGATVHMLYLPSRRDVRSITATLGRLESRVEELSERIEEIEGTPE